MAVLTNPMLESYLPVDPSPIQTMDLLVVAASSVFKRATALSLPFSLFILILTAPLWHHMVQKYHGLPTQTIRSEIMQL